MPSRYLKRVACWIALLLFGLLAPASPHARAEPRRFAYFAGGRYLVVEFLDDDLLHVGLSTSPLDLDAQRPIPTSPMVLKTDYSGPTSLSDDGHGRLETPQLRVQVDLARLCVTVSDRTRDPDLRLTTLCPVSSAAGWQGLTLTRESFTHVYGLGEQFLTPGQTDSDWAAQVRSPGGPFGNSMLHWNGGVVGNAQFPIAYFLGSGTDAYALFLDSPSAQTWGLNANPWTVQVNADPLCLYVLAGPDLVDLRQDYLELTGRPPVPPKQAFGLWVSEYGYDNWAELDDKLRTLRANGFPVDGFLLDLQWYGGVADGSDDSRMGSLTWDLQSFPDPQGKLARLAQQGIGIMLIEEPYLARGQPAYADLAQRGYLARECATCGPAYLTENPWWGKGGMLDWTNGAAGAYWHDLKREPLIVSGVLGFWTDLGEPEAYDPGAWYAGVDGEGADSHTEAAVHNLYNLKWSQSIYEGYVRHGHAQRPFILSRSGTSGSQRYGVAMWSGDIGSNLSSLATHLNVQMQMSLSGVDHFGADIGGFYRSGLQGDLNEVYTQWFADGMAFDVPGRSHTQNLCNCQETAPDRIGDVPSNLDNVRQRYELSPYLYSLAHRAYLYGEPVVPPLVYYYPSDPNVRTLGSEKLLGRDLLVAAVASNGARDRTVYLPAGDWVNYHSNEWYHSAGESVGPLPLYVDGKFKLPAFARAGAILPQMYVDDRTLNVLGQRSDGTRRDELIVRVYAAPTASQFTLYEDDGVSVAYQNGEVRTTVISQQQVGDRVSVTIAAAHGGYAGAPARRDNVVRLVVNHPAGASRVTLNGSPLAQAASQADFDAAGSAWGNAGRNLIVARSGGADVSADKVLEFELATSGPQGTWQPATSIEGQPPVASQPEHVDLRQFFLLWAVLVVVIAVSLVMGRRQEHGHHVP